MKAIRELLLGTRMALAGGVSGWLRCALTGLGVGLGVAVLLLAASLPHALAARHARTDARVDLSFGAPPPRSESTILLQDAATLFRDAMIRGRLVQAEGSQPIVPPGLSRVPEVGHLAVSPALARLLAQPDAALLRERLDYPVDEIIADQGLAGPSELVFYLGTDTLAAGQRDVTRLAAFGSTEPREGLDPVLSLLVVVIVVVLLVPIGLFVASAVRFGGEARDRRLAGVRLLGADARMARRIAAGEALASALVGLVIGAVLFGVGVAVTPSLELFGLSSFASDIRPNPVLTVLLVIGVPVAAVLVTIASLRRIVAEPLGVVRRAGDTRRRLWWRLLLPVVGIALLTPLVGTVQRDRGDANVVQLGAGIILVLVGVAALLPWIVQAAVRRLGGGPVPWQLAVRRLRLDSATASRAVTGIAVAVAGAIALQTLFHSVERQYLTSTGADLSRADLSTSVPITSGWEAVRSVQSAMLATPGVVAVHPRVSLSATVTPAAGSEVGSGADAEQDAWSLVTVADCVTLRDLASIDQCEDGDVFVIPPSEAIVPGPGTVLLLDAEPNADDVPTGSWTLPAGARVVDPRPDPTGATVFGVLATPAAFPTQTLADRARTMISTVDLDDDDPDAAERLRNTLWRWSPTSATTLLVTEVPTSRFAAVRSGLFAASSVTLVLIGVSLLVGMLEQLRERRRVLAGLVALGVRRGSIGWSILWQAVVPVALGMLLAVGAGVAVGAVLLNIVNEPVSVDWGSVGLMSGAAALVVVAVTGLSLPLLWRLMRPEGLRAE